MDVSEIRNEADALDQSIALNRITLAMLDEQKQSNKRMFIVTLISLFIALCMVVVSTITYKNFKDFVNDIEIEYEETTTTTFDQEVEGDDARINNVMGDQYNDNAVHNEGGSD